jgi:hypothetical protein
VTLALSQQTPELALRAILSKLRDEAGAACATDVAHGLDALDERLRSRRLLVAVIGEHNRGKSTLVNSLIGEAWLPMGQGAPTLPPVYVYGGAREHVELVYADGNTVECTRSELLSLSADEAESVSHARVAIPSDDVRGFTLVDTPGLNDPETSRLAQTVYGLLPQSDLALLILDSTQALGASEKELLERRIAQAGLHRLVVILNRDDALEGEEQRAEVRGRVSRLFMTALGKEPEVLPYAARIALRARERDDERMLARSGYPELRALLSECVATRAVVLREIVARRAADLAQMLHARLSQPVAMPAPPMDADDGDHREQAERACRAVEAIRDEFKLQLQGFTLALRDRIPDETTEASISDIRRFLPFFIQEEYAAFLREHDAQVREKVQSVVRAAGVADWKAERLTTGAPAPGLHPYVEPDFLEDSILLTTFMTVIGLTMKPIVAGAMMSIGPILRMLTRGMYDQTTKSALVQSAMAATMEAGQALEGQIDTSFADLTRGVREGSPEPTPQAEIVFDDSSRREARDRVSALVDALAQHAQGRGESPT